MSEVPEPIPTSEFVGLDPNFTGGRPSGKREPHDELEEALAAITAERDQALSRLEWLERDESGSWSKALDLIRTDLVEPLEAERDRYKEALDLAAQAFGQIENIPIPCRNPDGDEQGVETAHLIAREARAAIPEGEKDD